jgi:hypothetical protein
MKTTLLKNIVNNSVGYCKADDWLRNAITDAVLGYDSKIIIDDDIIGRVVVIEDMSEHAYNQENTICAIAQILDLNDSIVTTIAYYSDNAQHYLDIVPDNTTCEDWAREIGLDSPVAEFLGLEDNNE